MTARPIYETDDTRSIELHMAAVISRFWHCDVVKLPKSYRLDYAAMRERRIVAWLELKRRYHNFGNFDCVFLSLQKVLSAVELHDHSGLPCLFVIQCNNGFFYADMVAPRSIEFRGRVDRNDWQDQEPVAMVPVAEFRKMKLLTVVE